MTTNDPCACTGHPDGPCDLCVAVLEGVYIERARIRAGVEAFTRNAGMTPDDAARVEREYQIAGLGEYFESGFGAALRDVLVLIDEET